MKINLVVDLGNSQTRAAVIGKEGLIKPIREYFVLENAYHIYKHKDGFNLAGYEGSGSVIFKANNSKDSVMYTTGSISKEYVGKEQPTGLTTKYKANTTEIGLARTMIEALTIVAKQEGKTVSEIAQVIEVNLIVLVPPLEVASALTHFEQKYAKGMYIGVAFPESLALGANIKINNVKVLNEGLMGYMAATIDYTKMNNRELKYDITKSEVLVLDIGAGTTELMLINNNKMVENSRTTLRIGGLNVINKAKGYIEEMHEISISNEQAREAAITGYLTIGRKQIDVIDIINNTRAEVAEATVNDINNYLSGMTIPLTSVTDILVFGGGAIKAKGTGLKSIDSYIQQTLTDYAVGAEIVDLSDYIDKEVDERITGDVLTFNERTLNIIGAITAVEIMIAQNVL